MSSNTVELRQAWVQYQVLGPAIALFATGGMSFGIALVIIGWSLGAYPRPIAGWEVVLWVLVLLPPILILLASWNLRRTRRWWLVRIGCLAAISPLHAAYPFGLLAGVWAFEVLAQRDVANAFDS